MSAAEHPDPAYDGPPGPVDMFVAARSYPAEVVVTDDGETTRVYMWSARIETSDGRTAEAIDEHKTHAIATVVGKILAEDPTTRYRLYPHDRIYHRLSKVCDCDVCALLDQAPEYANIDVTAGSMDTLDAWEVVSDRCDATLADRAVPGVVYCRHALVPCEEIRDERGVVTYRRLPHHLPDEILVYTDASQAMGRTNKNICAIAAVAEDGTYAVDRVDPRRAGIPGIDYAELAAIEMGLRWRIGRSHRIVIRSDSREALRLVEKARSGGPLGSTGRVLGMVTGITDMISTYEQLGGEVVLEWVKGHSGDPLNEGADRIAIHARRAIEWDTFDTEAIREQCRLIAEESVERYQRSLGEMKVPA